MSVFDIIDTGFKKIESFKNDYMKVINSFNEVKDIKDTSNVTEKQKQAYKNIGEGIKKVTNPVVNNLKPVVEKLKPVVENVRVKAQQFETGIRQYHQIKDLEKKPFVDLNPKEQETYKTFLNTARDYGNTYAKLKQESGFTVMQPEIDSNKKALIIGIDTKQKQYEKYKDNIINKIYGDSTGTNIAGQTFAQIMDRGMTGERTDPNIWGNQDLSTTEKIGATAERLTYGAAGILGNLGKVLTENVNPDDENESAYNIWNNAQLSNFDKITKTAEYVGKKLQLDIPLSWQGIDQNALEASKQKHFDAASKKIGENLSGFWGDIPKKSGGVIAGYVEFFTAPIMPFFEEEVTGKTMENVGAIISLPFQALASATSESLQAFGVDKETADNWGTVVGAFGPSAVRAGVNKAKAAKTITAETAFIGTLPKDQQKMYVDTRKQIEEMKNIEEKINTEKSLYKRPGTNRFEIVEKTKETSISAIGPKTRDFSEAMLKGDFEKAKLIKSELDTTYLQYKEIAASKKRIANQRAIDYMFNSERQGSTYYSSIVPIGMLDSIFYGIENIKRTKGAEDLIKTISSLPVKDLASNAVKSSIAQSVAKHTNDMGLSLDEMDVVTNNILGLLEEKKTNVEKTIQDLNNHIANKSTARESINFGKITKEDFNLKFKDNTGDLAKGLPENRTEFNYIKSLENSGVLKEVAKIETDTGIQRLYQSEDYNLNLTYPEDIAKIFETRNKLSENYKFEKQQIFDLENEINAKTDFRTQLEKNFKKSGMSAEGYTKKEVERVLAKKGELAKIEMEIEASKPGERVYLEREIGSGRDVVASPSTFPKWIPEDLRNKKLMTSTWDKLTRGDLDIPKQNIKQQKMMSVYLDRLGSELKDIYNVDLKALTKDKDLKQIQILKDRLKNSKAFSRAYYNEYKKVNNQANTVRERLVNLKESSLEAKQKLQNRLIELRDTYKNRKSIISEIQKEYKLTDTEFNKILTTKNYLKFKEYEFKDFASKLEEAAYKTAELKYEQLSIEQQIKDKQLTNIQNVFGAFELPSSISKMSFEDLKKLETIIEESEKGDIFIGKNLMKRFSIVEEGQGIRTLRDMLEALETNIPEIKNRLASVDQITKDIYLGAISDVEAQLSRTTKLLKETKDSPETELKLKDELKNLEEQKTELTKDYDSVHRSLINNISYKDNKDKTTHQKVSENKYSKGGVLDNYLPDTFLSHKDLYFNFIVSLYYQNKVKYDKRVKEVEDKLIPLIRDSRKSTAKLLSKDKTLTQKIIDYLVPTDDIPIKYMEASSKDKMDMILKGELTKENMDLIHFTQDFFSEIGAELQKRQAIGDLLNNYVSHMAPGTLQTAKYKGLSEGIKAIFTKEDHVFDFGALGKRDEVLGYEKNFRFSFERTGMQDYNKNLGIIVMGYAKTFYKKLTLDEVTPKAVLYGNVLSDSGSKKTATAWINNKKGIQLDDLQGTGFEKTLLGLNYFIVLKDLGHNIPSAIFSMAGAFGRNLALLGEKNFVIGAKRKLTKEGRAILKEFEGTFGRNPLWNINEDLFKRPDINPLEIPVLSAFAMMGQVFKSAMNTAFLGMLTKEEFASGKISDKRAAEIILEMGKFHAMPGSKSIKGSTLTGKVFMTYQGWKVPLLMSTSELVARLAPDKKLNFKNSTSYKEGTYKKDLHTLFRLYGYSWAVIYTAYYLTRDDEDEKITKWFNKLGYGAKRLFSETASPTSAMNPIAWLSSPRLITFAGDILTSLYQLAVQDEYESTKKGEYEYGDLKGLKGITKTFTPGFVKQFEVMNDILDSIEGKSTKTSTSKTKKKRKRVSY